jgi:hypothetical protein
MSASSGERLAPTQPQLLTLSAKSTSELQRFTHSRENEVIGVINLVTGEVRSIEVPDSTPNRSGHIYVRKPHERDYVVFHTHPSDFKNSKDFHRPPSAPDLLIVSIHCAYYGHPVQAVVADVNGYYVYTPKCYKTSLLKLTKIEVVDGTACIDIEELRADSDTDYAKERQREMQVQLNSIFNNEMDRSHKLFEDAIIDIYDRAGFHIKYVRFQDVLTDTSLCSSASS